ncbi:MAG: O-antigen ligase family protein [Desulfobacula sp.]|nr:O-antigen ligase family protein [Desulfobacula sp.]
MSATILLILGVLFVLVILSVKHPIYPLMGYLIIYCTYNKYTWWSKQIGDFLFNQPSFTFATIFILSAIFNSGKLNWQITKRELLIYVFLFVIVLSSLFFWESSDEYMLSKLIKIIVIIFFVLRTITTKKHLDLIIWTISLCAIFLSLKAFIAPSSYFIDGRLDSLGGPDFQEANGFSAFLSIALICLSFKFLETSFLKKILYLPAIVLILNTIVLCQSRSVMLGLVLAMLICVTISSFKRKQIFLYSVLGIVLLFVVADQRFINRIMLFGNSYGDSEIINSNSNIQTYDQAKSGRFEFWAASVYMFKDYPLGVGLKNFPIYAGNYREIAAGRDPHNTYVLCYSELGAQGFLLFIMIIATSIIQLYKLLDKSKSSNNLFILVLSFLLIHVVYFSFYSLTHSCLYTELLWWILAIPIVLERIEKNYKSAGVVATNEN